LIVEPLTSIRLPPERMNATKPTWPFSVNAESVMRNSVRSITSRMRYLLNGPNRIDLAFAAITATSWFTTIGRPSRRSGAPPGLPCS
jgi:hypothetical protein